VLVPESGDAVQAMKAGLMEIADVFVINKADREGAERAAFAIRSALELRAHTSEWRIPVEQTVASQNKGVGLLADRFEEHLAFMRETGSLERRRRHRLEQRLADLVRARLWSGFRTALAPGAWEDAIASLGDRRETPHQAAARLLGGEGATRD
jgi:LAO/AO transport system kinase